MIHFLPSKHRAYNIVTKFQLCLLQLSIQRYQFCCVYLLPFQIVEWFRCFSICFTAVESRLPRQAEEVRHEPLAELPSRLNS